MKKVNVVKQHLPFMIIFGLFLVSGLLSATSTQENQHYRVSQVDSRIDVDGNLDDPGWQEAVTIKLAYEYRPGDNTPAPVETECLITYSESKLYIAFRCFDPEPRKIQAHLMDRDSVSKLNLDDYVSLYFDSFNDRRYAYHFRINPLGVQADALYSEMGGDLNFSWDAIWASAGRITDWGYAVEIAIPFNQFRFSKSSGEITWGFVAERYYPRNIRRRMTANFRDRNKSCFLCQADRMEGLKNITSGNNIELKPTLTMLRTDEIDTFPGGELQTGKIKTDPGISMKWGIRSDLVLNFTLNPDFSQVEADAAQLDVNRRFAIYYPEKRPFFLEGADFFRTPLEIVFTRTVADPLWGAKVTAKMGKDAVGFFATQDQMCNLLIPNSQYSISTSLDTNVLGGVFRYRRDVGKSSTLGLILTTRNGDDYFNHVIGADGFLRLDKSNRVRFQYLYSTSRYPDDLAADYSQKNDTFGGDFLLVEFTHASRNWLFQAAYDDISPDFRADFGFIFRTGLRYYAGVLMRHFYGKSGGWCDLVNVSLMGYKMVDHQGDLVEQKLIAGVDYSGPLQSRILLNGCLIEELYSNVTQEYKYADADVSLRPFKGARIGVYGKYGQAFDYSNLRLADVVNIQPRIDLALGRHLRLNLSHDFEYLSRDDEKIYRVNLSQARFVYNFNLRTFIRVVLQYQHLEKNPELYISPVTPKSEDFFTQVLFSYKINPHTVLFIGYSDNHVGVTGYRLDQVNRTFFLKLGYALGL